MPGGVRLGSPALTTRGLIEKDFEQVARLIDRGIQLSITLKNDMGKGKKIKDF